MRCLDQMEFHGTFRNTENDRNLPGGLSAGGPSQNLSFAGRQQVALFRFRPAKRANAVVGVDSDQLERALREGIDSELFSGHADDCTAFVIMKRNAISLHQAKLGSAGHHEMGGRIAVSILTRLAPFEQLDRRSAMSRNGV